MNMPTPEPAPVRSLNRTMLRVLSVAVGALLTANGVILAENTTGTDFEDFFRDGIEDARGALARLLDPDTEGTEAAAGDTTTSTTAAPSSTPSTEGGDTSSTTAPPSSEAGQPSDPGSGAPSTSGTGKKPATPSKGTTAPTTPAATPGGQLGGTPVTPASAEEKALGTLRSFVEQQRGLTFKAAPPVVHLAGDAFKARLADYRLGAKTAAASRSEGALKSLGVIDGAVNLVAQINRLLMGSAPAFYDASANELVIRDAIDAPFTRKILIHELTHALNDQHFELHRPALRETGDESFQSFEALYEGIASDMEDRYVKSLPKDQQDAIDAEQKRLAGAFPKDLPPYVLINFGFPYTAGKRLATSLLAAGGNGRLNEALARPPVTSEQVLRPEKFTAGEGPKAVPAPAADGAVVSQGVMGQLTLALMLAASVDGATAEAAADGWGGDRYVAWRNGNQTCVRLAVVMDSPEHTAELGQALTEWATVNPGGVVEGAGPFTVTRCA